MRSDITIAVHAIARGARPAYVQDMHGVLQKQQALFCSKGLREGGNRACLFQRPLKSCRAITTKKLDPAVYGLPVK